LRRSPYAELEFDTTVQLIAAHARTRVGRELLASSATLPDFSEAMIRASFNAALLEAVELDGPLPLDGVDDAAAWLDDDGPPPSEPRHYLSLLALAKRVAAVRRRLAGLPEELALLADVAEELPDTSGLVALVSPLLGRDGSIPDDATLELARLRRAAGRQRMELQRVLAGVRRAHGDAVTDAPPTLRRDRYCIPVRAAARSQLPGLLLDTSASGATVFVEPFEAVDLNNALAESAARERHELQRILRLIGDAFADAAGELRDAVAVLARLDAAQAAVLFGRAVDGRIVFPEEGVELRLSRARHPLLDECLRKLRTEVLGEAEERRDERPVVPLDLAMERGLHTLVISGPNAGGKTVVLKTVGLMVLLCYHGVPLPVDADTTIPKIDDLWCHIGDEQDVTADLSTFSGAMAATARLLDRAGKGTLVLYDELGAGTDPLEGAALGCALLETLNGRGAATIATTHLAAIAMVASSTEGFDNAAMEYDEAQERPTYRLVLGRPGRSRALEIAQRMGVPDSVLTRAEALLGGEHLELDRWLRRLERLENELLDERAAIARREAELAKLVQSVEIELARAQQEKVRAADDLDRQREALKRQAKQQLDRATAKLEKATRDLKPLGRKRLQKLREEALDLGGRDRHVRAAEHEGPEIGARVRLSVLGGEGVVDEIRGSRVSVVMGNKKVWVPLTDVAVLDRPQARQKRRVVQVEVSDEPPREIMLLGMDSERARDEVEKALDQAFSAGARSIRIVHGHGTGTLRRMVADVCREHPAVKSYKHPPGNRGGTGATEVELEESG
jgi:DNA mismatch repair protein MutS2